MKIAVIGAGNMGGRLGALWAERGYELVFGVRDPSGEKIRTLLQGSAARAASIPEVAAFGEVVVLAVPWGAAQNVLVEAGDLVGKVVVDATNPLGQIPDGMQSGAEEIARWAPGARVVKAFNSLGAENLSTLDAYQGQRAAAFICGDAAEAKTVVSGLAAELGFDPVDAGTLASAAMLESLARLWITLARSAGRDFAFGVLRR